MTEADAAVTTSTSARRQDRALRRLRDAGPVPERDHRGAPGGPEGGRAVRRLAHGRVRGARRCGGFVQYVTTNDASRLEEWDRRSTPLCREDGGILIDDCIVYRFPDHYMLVVNASNRSGPGLDLAARGPVRRGPDGPLGRDGRSSRCRDRRARRSWRASPTRRPRRRSATTTSPRARWPAAPRVISRTGYTGEDGFELYLPADAPAVWRRCWRPAAADGLVPAGLGARDSLRLEMGYALYGNDMDERARRWRRGSAGSRSWTRATSSGATRSNGRRRRGSGSGWPASGSPPAASRGTATP
jgi:hypothetical protein